MKSLKEYKENMEVLHCICPVCGTEILRETVEESYEVSNKEEIGTISSLFCRNCNTTIIETYSLMKVQIVTKEGDIETLTNSHENEHKLEKYINI